MFSDLTVQYSEAFSKRINSPLPSTPPPCLTISDVPEGAVEGVVRIVEVLSPKNKRFEEIHLRHCSLSSSEAQNLCYSLTSKGLRTDSVVTQVTENDYEPFLKFEMNEPPVTHRSYQIQVGPYIDVNRCNLIVSAKEFIEGNNLEGCDLSVSINLKNRLTDVDLVNLKELAIILRRNSLKNIQLLLHESYNEGRAEIKQFLIELKETNFVCEQFKGFIGPNGEEELKILRDKAVCESWTSLSLSPENDFSLLADIQGDLGELQTKTLCLLRNFIMNFRHKFFAKL